jgi:hypothetical protein
LRSISGDGVGRGHTIQQEIPRAMTVANKAVLLFHCTPFHLAVLQTKSMLELVFGHLACIG